LTLDFLLVFPPERVEAADLRDIRRLEFLLEEAGVMKPIWDLKKMRRC
jgi:hypothetical protein